jgi:hypothetical protein
MGSMLMMIARRTRRRSGSVEILVRRLRLLLLRVEELVARNKEEAI